MKRREVCGRGGEPQNSEAESNLRNSFYGLIFQRLLLDVHDGFYFVVNKDGKIGYISTNVKTYLKHRAGSLIENSIYNIIHVDDHATFSNNLLSMSMGNGNGGEGSGEGRKLSFQCRFLIRPPSDSKEEKQARVSLHEQMNVVLGKDPEEPNRFCCLAKRIPTEEKSGISDTPPEQFTTAGLTG